MAVSGAGMVTIATAFGVSLARLNGLACERSGGRERLPGR